jgi:hypothetical protein
MNPRTVAIQILIFSIQWVLMIIGFYFLAEVLAPVQVIPSYISYNRIIDSAVKAGTALVMSLFWLYVWDRQVRLFVFRNER